MLASRHFVLAALVVVASCSTKAPAATGGTAGQERTARNPDVISREELRDPAIAGTDAMSAIRQLRPAFFRTRGPMSIRNQTAGLVQISQDFGPLQPLNALNGVEVRSLIEVRYLSAVDAQSRFGINANGGPVIVLLTSAQ
jgi:hypothetical protein